MRGRPRGEDIQGSICFSEYLGEGEHDLTLEHGVCTLALSSVGAMDMAGRANAWGVTWNRGGVYDLVLRVGVDLRASGVLDSGE